MATFDFSIKSVLGYLEYNGRRKKYVKGGPSRGGRVRQLGTEGQIWEFFLN